MSSDTWKGLILGTLVTIVISFIFYKLSVAERGPTFIVDPQRALVIDSESLKDSPIRVTRADGTPRIQTRSATLI